MKNIFFIIVLFCCPLLASAQFDMKMSVTFDYDNEKLSKVLKDIHKRYKVNFSYSKNYISVNKRLTAFVEQQPLSKALDELFSDTKIVYRHIGDQIVLKEDENKVIRKKESLGSIEKKKEPVLVLPEEEKPSMIGQRMVKVPQAIQPQELPSQIKLELPEEYKSEVDFSDIKQPNPIKDHHLYINGIDINTPNAQMSVLPGVGKISPDHEEDVPTHLSLNLIWGHNESVDGLEIGVGFNSIEENVKGFQLAGLGNVVAGNVDGTQISGLFNINNGLTEGVQFSAWVNIVRDINAIQIAGIGNYVKGDFKGFQMGGIGNITHGNTSGIQIAGGFNYNKEGSTNIQVSSLFNIAKDVETAQVAGIYNQAKHVKGIQFGLINVCDSVDVASIGLFNFVKHGYNRVELSSNEILYANAAVKLGSERFYNIIQFGYRVDETTWGLGYGIGSKMKLKRKLFFNPEIQTMHINENEYWTNKLNLLSQLKLNVGIELGKRVELILGPTFNLMASNLYNADTNTYGSSLAPYTIINQTSTNSIEPTNKQAWFGFNAGLRF